MDIKIQETNPTRRTVTVTIPAADVATAEKEVLKGFKREAALPGFRPGKAPESALRLKYGKAIADEVSQRLLSQGYERISQEKGFTVYTLADVHRDDTTAAGADVVIRYEVDVVPEFKTPDWKSVRIPGEAVVVTEADIEEHLKKILEQRARYEKTEDAALKSDYVRIAYTGTIDGKAVTEIDAEAKSYGSAESTWEEAGAEGEAVAVPAIAKAVIGLKAGDTAKTEFTFPATHEREALRGKTVHYAITANEVRRKTMPALDETFIKSVGVKDEAELRDQLRKGIEGSKQQAAETARREKAVDALLAGQDFPLPESAINSVAQGLFMEYAQLRMRNGVKPEQLETQREEILAESRKAAAIRVRAQFVLTRIAEEAKIEISREDLSAAIMRAAYTAQVPPEKLVKDRQRLNEIRRDTLLNKALDLVLAGGSEGKVEKA
ncbi:MAG: trigger factor [Opitutales bacterium]|nr:MAG: trigger factor [Opitutales bacterium]